MTKINILGIDISMITASELEHQIQDILSQESGHIVIVTPNPEFVLKAQNDLDFQNALNLADFAVCDGIGLCYAVWFLKNIILKRITGSDLVMRILTIAHQQNKKIFCISADGGFSQPKEIIQAIQKKYPHIKVHCEALISSHPEIIKDKNYKIGDGLTNDQVLQAIQKFEADIVLVGLGQVIQEKWIIKNKSLLPSVRLFMGVGGSFDYLTQKKKRAPQIMRFLGLEWLWRVCIQPNRIGRIWKACIVFPLYVVRAKLCRKY